MDRGFFPQMHRGFDRGYMHHGYFHDGGRPHVLAWVIFALLVAVLVGVAVLIASRYAARRGARLGRPAIAGGPPDPLLLLQLRYARGEINRDEYLQASRDLGGPVSEPSEPPSPPAEPPTA